MFENCSSIISDLKTNQDEIKNNNDYKNEKINDKNITGDNNIINNRNIVKEMNIIKVIKNSIIGNENKSFDEINNSFITIIF